MLSSNTLEKAGADVRRLNTIIQSGRDNGSEVIQVQRLVDKYIAADCGSNPDIEALLKEGQRMVKKAMRSSKPKLDS